MVADALLGATHHARYWFNAARHGSYEAVADELWDLIAGGLRPGPSQP